MSVGWYVHHHGSGHLQRFLAIHERLPEVVGFSGLPRPPGVRRAGWVELAADTPAAAGDEPEAGGGLHWAPLGHDGLRARMATLAAWVARDRPAAFVCDVSVEVALLVRLFGVPVIWIAQRGHRVDDPHRLAYRACTVVAPWTAALDSPGSGLPDDTVHIGALSRFDDRRPAPAPQRRAVLVLLGRGGHDVTAEQVTDAAGATPDWTWTVAGLGQPVRAPLRDAGSPADPWRLLCDADVVVGAPGGGLVAEVAAARRSLVCLPQPRPFDEQRDAAAVLQRSGLAESLAAWPVAERWPEILRRASRRDPGRWSILHDGRAGDRLVATLSARALARAG